MPSPHTELSEMRGQYCPRGFFLPSLVVSRKKRIAADSSPEGRGRGHPDRVPRRSLSFFLEFESALLHQPENSRIIFIAHIPLVSPESLEDRLKPPQTEN